MINSNIIFLFFYHVSLCILGCLFYENFLFKDFDNSFSLVKIIFCCSFVLCLSLLSMILFEITGFIATRLQLFIWYIDISLMILFIYIIIPISLIYTYVTYEDEKASNSLFKFQYFYTTLIKMNNKKKKKKFHSPDEENKKEREREKYQDKGQEKYQDKEQEKYQDKEQEKNQDEGQEKNQDKEQEKNHHKEQEKNHHKEQEKNQDKEQEKNQDKEQEKTHFMKRLLYVSEDLIEEMKNYNYKIKYKNKQKLYKFIFGCIFLLPIIWFTFYKISMLTLKNNKDIYDKSDIYNIGSILLDKFNEINKEFEEEYNINNDKNNYFFFFNFMKNLLTYMSVTGMTIVSALSAFTSLYSPYSNISNFFFFVNIKKVKVIEKKIKFIKQQLSSKKKILLLYEYHPHLLKPFYENQKREYNNIHNNMSSYKYINDSNNYNDYRNDIELQNINECKNIYHNDDNTTNCMTSSLRSATSRENNNIENNNIENNNIENNNIENNNIENNNIENNNNNNYVNLNKILNHTNNLNTGYFQNNKISINNSGNSYEQYYNNYKNVNSFNIKNMILCNNEKDGIHRTYKNHQVIKNEDYENKDNNNIKRENKKEEIFFTSFKSYKKCNLYLGNYKSIYKDIYETFIKRENSFISLFNIKELSQRKSNNNLLYITEKINCENYSMDDIIIVNGIKNKYKKQNNKRIKLYKNNDLEEKDTSCIDEYNQDDCLINIFSNNDIKNYSYIRNSKQNSFNQQCVLSSFNQNINSNNSLYKRNIKSSNDLLDDTHMEYQKKFHFFKTKEQNISLENKVTDDYRREYKYENGKYKTFFLFNYPIFSFKRLFKGSKNNMAGKEYHLSDSIHMNREANNTINQNNKNNCDHNNNINCNNIHSFNYKSEGFIRKSVISSFFYGFRKPYKTLQSVKEFFTGRKDNVNKKSKQVLIQDIKSLEYMIKKLYFLLDDVIKEQIRINQSTTFCGILLYILGIIMSILCVYKIIKTCYIIYMIEIHYKFISTYSSGHVLMLFYSKNMNISIINELKNVLHIVHININLDNYVISITSILLLCFIFTNLKTFMEKIIKLRYSTKSSLYSNLAILVMCEIMDLYFSAYCIQLFDYLPIKEKIKMLYIFFNNNLLNLFKLKYHFDFVYVISLFISLILLKFHHKNKSDQFKEI
ncbi:putative membrane protein [Plasmodium reichenowi]|uniref:Putative membrane protein n=1 Tax=Plasmodium reichenowi TaxID=5854 RepID=A0A151L4K9_PLARE|nr:putative membrane protein [Plasmodium reichenowi]KYN93864.1 putative membrane protein [Plasmodium reichenowi]